MKTSELIELAKQHGYTVSSRQIQLWTKEQILPLSDKNLNVNGRGLEVIYAESANEQLLEICKLRSNKITNYDDLSWNLFLLKYPIPLERVRRLMRNAKTSLPKPIKINTAKITKENITECLLILILNLIHSFSEDPFWLEEFRDIIEDELATCLGTGNLFTKKSKNIPESTYLFKEESTQPKIIEPINDLYREHLKNPNLYKDFAKNNYLLPEDFNPKLFDKLFFFQRIYYLFYSILKLFKFNITESIINIPNEKLIEYRDFMYDLIPEIQNLVTPYKSFYSLLLPIYWSLAGIFTDPDKIKDLEDFYSAENIQDEPWFKNNPFQAMDRMANALRYTTHNVKSDKDEKLDTPYKALINFFAIIDKIN